MRGAAVALVCGRGCVLATPRDFCRKNYGKIAKTVDKVLFLVYNYMYLQECAAEGRDFEQYGKGNGLRNERRFVEND